jgi:hypothetical protein
MRIFQPIITGSLNVSGSVTAFSFTGSLQGSASYAITASYAMNGGGGSSNPGGSNTQIQYNNSNAFGGVPVLTYDGSRLVGTGSFSGSFTGEFNGTVTTAATASYSTNFTAATSLTVDGAQIRGASVNSTIVGSNNLFTQATGSYTSAIANYTLRNGANARAGQFITVWNGTTTSYTDISTVDIGSTSDITFVSSIVSNNIQINATALTSGWTIKMLVTYL